MTSAAGTTAAASAATLADVERLALAQLPADRWGFLAGGAGEELTMAANRAAFEAIRVVPRVLCDVSTADCAVDLLGAPATMPLAVAPMAFQRLFHPDGELAGARAARRAGVPFVVGTMSSVPVEEIAATGVATWFQLYWLRDRGLTAELLGRAEAAGCAAIMLTVDVPQMGRRMRDVRNSFTLPPNVRAVHLPTQGQRLTVGGHAALSIDPSLSWPDLEWLRSRTRLPLVLKGVLCAEDAVRAADAGVEAVVVSNHGGRQLDGAIASLDALPAVRAAIGERCAVLLDSGIRSGLDVLRALATGADAVLLGRPVLHGLATGGEAGVGHVLGLVREELGVALALAGCPDPAAARRLHTVRTPDPA